MPLYDAYGRPVPSNSPPEKQEPNKPEKRWPQWFQKVRQLGKTHPVMAVFGSLVSIALVVIGVLEFADLFFGRHPWPSLPDVEAHNSASSSSSILPFDVINTSIWPINNAVLGCYLNLVYVMDANRRTILLRDAIFSEGAVAISPEINYYCNSQYLSVRQDGSLLIGFPAGQNMTTKPGAFTPPLTTLKLCVMVTGRYSTFGFTRNIKSAMFQWPNNPEGNQWVKGPIAFDNDQSKWIPENSTLGAVYGLRPLTGKHPDGTTYLLPDALKCDVVK